MRLRGGITAWLWLIGSMLSMFTWRIVQALGIHPPAFFNPLIAIWGSSCLVLSMFYFGREISRRVRAEQQRDDLLESERAAREQAERANRLKDQFLGALSHELRTPLTAILGWCELLRQEMACDDQGREAVETIERNARAQSMLIEDLLDMTRINAGTLRLERRLVAASGPVLAALETVRPAAHARQIRFEQEIDPSVRVLVDPMRLQQVVWNLLNNAVKFTPDGGTVRVNLCARERRAVLTVVDTGEGIPPDFLPSLFSPFRQVDGSSARRHGGLGLGLSIVKSLVELHGGTVSAASPGVGRGATFEVALPAENANELPFLPDSQGPVSGVCLAGVKVLVVEDEADLRSMICRFLERAGAEVQAHAGAADALRGFDAFGPDVIVSDIGMPGQDGYSMLRELRSRVGAEQTPAIALTAYARETDREKAIRSGFQAHLAKPVDAAQLLAAVARHAPGRSLSAASGRRDARESRGAVGVEDSISRDS